MESLSSLFPTDNLYKFFSITGLVIFGFCFVYPDIKLAELNLKAISIKSDSTILSYEVKEIEKVLADLKEQEKDLKKTQAIQNWLLEPKGFYVSNSKKYSEDTTTIAQDLEQAKKDEKLLKDRNEREYFEFMIKHGDDIYPLDREIENYNKLTEEYDKNVNTLNLKLIKRRFIQSQMKLEEDRIQKIRIYGCLGRIFGLVMSVFGFFFWYKLHQQPQDKLLKNQLEEFNHKKNTHTNKTG